MSNELIQMSIGRDDETLLADAMVITEEVSLLLQQNGIDPSGVNRLFIPSGYTRVGTFTILTYLASETNWLEDDLWAFVGPLKWRLSRHYNIHRIFPSKSHEDATSTPSLAVVTFYDFRYDINLGNSGTTSAKYDNNSYTDDWRVQKPSDWEGPEDEEVDEEMVGKSPIFTGVLDNPLLHFETPDSSEQPGFYDDYWTMWDNDTILSDAGRADRAIRSVGAVAVPYPLPRNIESLFPPDFSRTIENPNAYMTAAYIANGWKVAEEYAWKYEDLYADGQLLWCTIPPHDQQGVLEIVDDMTAGGDYVPLPQPIHSNFNVAQFADTVHGIPESVSVQFAARSSVLNKIIIYRIEGLKHGRPEVEPFGGPNSGFFPPITITDHIKTHAEFDVSEEEYESEMLSENGVSISVYVVSGYGSEDTPAGLTDERFNQLLTRAARISRMYYARFYSGVGTFTTQGFSLIHPWAGMQQLEYGFRNGMPYTKVSGNVNDERFGFSITEFAKDTVFTSGGAILSRPDGTTEIVSTTERPLVIPVEIEEVFLDEDGCRATYKVKNLINGKSIGDIENEIGLEPWREIPEVCYLPVERGEIGMLTMSSKFDEEDIEGSTENGYYLFIVKEEVQTTDCVEQAGGGEPLE